MKFTWRFGWNNWTFGFWWAGRKDRLGGRGVLLFGVDVGPLEMTWGERRLPRSPNRIGGKI